MRNLNGKRLEPRADFVIQNKEVPNLSVGVVSPTATFLTSYVTCYISEFFLAQHSLPHENNCNFSFSGLKTFSPFFDNNLPG